VSFTNWYWIGSGIPYETYLRKRDIALQGAAPVVSAISDQTREVVRAMDGMRAEIQQVDRTLNWGFSAMLLGMGALNQTLQELLKAVKTPAQTAAMEQFDIARDCVRRGLFPEALDAINAALEGNSASPGYKMEWRFHFLKGTLHLGSFENHDTAIVDLNRAEACFLEAARYAKADFPRDAARGLTAASWACLVSSSGDKAIVQRAHEHAQRALEIWSREDSGEDIDGCADAHYQFAKVSAILGNISDLKTSLVAAFSRGYALVGRAADDGDIAKYDATNVAYQQFVEGRRSWFQREMQRRLALAERAGMNDTNTAGALSRFRSLSANASLEVLLRNVTPGGTPALSDSLSAAWDGAVQSCVAPFKVLIDKRTFSWSDIEAAALGGAKFRLEQDSSRRGVAELNSVPVVGTTTELTIWRNDSWGEPALPPWRQTLQVTPGGIGVRFCCSMFHATLTSNQNKRYDVSAEAVAVIQDGSGLDTVVMWPDSDEKRRGVTEPYLFVESSTSCFPAWTIVRTAAGDTEICKVAAGDVCVVPDGTHRRVLHAVRHTSASEVLRVVWSDGTALHATPNHLIRSAAGWRAVGDLRVGDSALDGDGGIKTVTSMSGCGWSDTYNIVVEGGIFVADGTTVHSFTRMLTVRTLLWSALGRHAASIEAAAITLYGALLSIRREVSLALRATPRRDLPAGGAPV
jgi:hypothetical protein